MLWIDERFLTSKRPDAEKWYDHCLQIKYFDTNQGGELFFRRLEDLLIRRRLLFDADLDLEPDKSHYLTYRLINLWHKPGEGPDPTEGLLDTFSLCLVLGYQGRYSNYDPSELATIKEPAIEQLQSWRTRTAAVSQPRVRRQSFFQWAAVTWRNHGWILLHLVLPAALLGWLFVKSREIIANLPF
jgi:type VI protein secretion system component VasF